MLTKGGGMPEPKNFRWVVGRVAETGDALGTGGTRRADGTLAAQVRDLKYIDDDAASRLGSPPSRGSSPGRAMARELGAQAVAAAVDVLLREVVIPATAKLWRDRVAPAINRKWDEVRAKKAPTVETASVEFVEVKFDEAEDADSGTIIDVTDEPVIELSRDEAEWRITEAQRAARELAEHLALLRAARVVEDADIPALLAGRGQLQASSVAAIESSARTEEETDPEPVRQRLELPPSPKAWPSSERMTLPRTDGDPTTNS